MIERILNKLGFFTRKQYVKLAIAFVTNAKYVEVLEDENKKLKNDFKRVSKENEEFKSEIEKLRLKVVKSVKRKRR